MEERQLNSPDKYRYFVGIDWATKMHEVSIIDAQRTVLDAVQVEHSSRGIADLVERLGKLSGGEHEAVAIAIEMPRGALVETLMERSFHVYSLNPKQSDRFRDRHNVAGAKDDRLDAFVLADSLRTDMQLFRRITTDNPLVIQLREVSRIDDELREEFNRLSNRMREQLYRYFPQILELSPSADDPWLWNLLEVASTPDDARRLKQSRIEKLLKENRIRRITAEQVIAALRTPAIYVAPGTVEAAAGHVAMLIPRIRIVDNQRKECERRIQRLLDEIGSEENDLGNTNEHRDVGIILSLPGVGRKTAATVLAEANEAIRTRDLRALRAHSGIAPVTRRSGTRKVVIMRQACNGRLRTALYHAARVNVQRDAVSRLLYSALRAKGHSHGRACRTIADRMLRILMAMLRDGTNYIPKETTPVSAAEQEKEAA
jgi:transposase